MSARAVTATLIGFVLLAGCTTPDACADLAITTSVVELRGTDVVVDDGSLVLHAADTEIFLRRGPICGPATLADLHVGDGLGHDATEIAESYPMQAWPDTILVEKAG